MERIRSNLLLIVIIYTLFMISPSIYATDFQYCSLVLLVWPTCKTTSAKFNINDYTYADKKKDYDVKIIGVVISPDPVKRGKETSFTISAFTDKPLSKGKIKINVAYFGWNVYSETGDLCATLSCPIPAGDFRISNSQNLPTLAPPGPYTLTLKMQDSNKNELTCIKFDFSIGFFSSNEEMTDS